MLDKKMKARDNTVWSNNHIEVFGDCGDHSAPAVMLSVEHAGNLLPDYLLAQLSSADRHTLDSHRGFDLGAYNLARGLVTATPAIGVAGMFSRLFIDPCRPLGDQSSIVLEIDNRTIEFNSNISESDMSFREATYFEIHNLFANALKKRFLRNHEFIILSLHSMTPALGPSERQFDIDILPNFGHESFAKKAAEALSDEGFSVEWESAYSLRRRHAPDPEKRQVELAEPYYWLSRHALLEGLIPKQHSFRSIEIEVVQHKHLIGTPEDAFQTGQRIGKALSRLELRNDEAVLSW